MLLAAVKSVAHHAIYFHVLTETLVVRPPHESPQPVVTCRAPNRFSCRLQQPRLGRLRRLFRCVGLNLTSQHEVHQDSFIR